MRCDFRPGSTYDNVYFLFIDASGYSAIVRLNPRDRVAHAFDVLRNRVIARAQELAAARRCATTALWSWRGDGGFLVIHDENESVARDVALETARSVLTLDLRHLREELARAELRGELHIRLAVHKGPIQYALEHETGTIHSPEINFAAHLEEATPPDHLAISEDVYRVSGDFASLFELVGTHEGRAIYLMRTDGDTRTSRRAWLAHAGLTEGIPVHAYPQRPSQREKARLVGVAHSEIVDLGTALNTCSHYLVTTERPAYYRDAVLDFLRGGGVYQCVLLDPESEATSLYSRLRREEIGSKIRLALARFEQFKERHGSAADGLHVYQTDEFPGMAALCVDRDASDALILYSPYLLRVRPTTPAVERADMPHYLISPASGTLFAELARVINNATTGSAFRRVL
jgi:class 3 adenylate cyclase